MMRLPALFCGLAIFSLVGPPGSAQPRQTPARGISRVDLHNGWQLQSSAKVTAKGDRISTAASDPAGWYPTSVPSTVVHALVSNHVLPDPYFGMNLRSLPGTTGEIGDNLSNLPFPADSPFAVSWWFRTNFKLAPGFQGKRVWLNFDSINYRANIWLNGQQVAGSDQAAGMSAASSSMSPALRSPAATPWPWR